MMIRAKLRWCDQNPPEHWGDGNEWFRVEGDLDDFIFYDPLGPIPEPDWCK